MRYNDTTVDPFPCLIWGVVSTASFSFPLLLHALQRWSLLSPPVLLAGADFSAHEVFWCL